MKNADDAAPDVGSFAEEATKLFGALSGWAREHAGEAVEGISGLAAEVAATAHDRNDHIATGSAECAACPICRGVHAVRQLSPEVKSHLASAAISLAHAAASLMAPPLAPERAARSDVKHIDLHSEGFEA